MIRSFIKSISRFWYAYVISFLACLFIIDYSLNLINAPRNEETMTIFVADAKGSVKQMRDYLFENRPQYLRDLNVYGAQVDGVKFDNYFKIYGMANSDMVILPESKIDEEVLIEHYAVLKDECVSEYVETPIYYVSEKTGLNFGLKVHSKGDENYLLSYSRDDYDEDYYAFFIRGSVHLGELSDSSWGTAFVFANLLMGGK